MLRQDYDPARHRPLLSPERHGWLVPLGLVILGGLFGWWIAAIRTWDDLGGEALRSLPTLLFTILLLRYGRPFQAAGLESPWADRHWFGLTSRLAVALLAGIPAAVAALVSGATPFRALLIGIIFVIVVAGAHLLQRTRPDRDAPSETG